MVKGIKSNKTTIAISAEVHEWLSGLRKYKTETFNDILLRIKNKSRNIGE